MKEQIEHEGIVREITDQNIKVGFVTQPSCAGCYAKGVCSIEEKEVETIDIIYNKGTTEFKIGEKVKIIINEAMGLKAVLIAYLIPFAILLLSLFILVSLLDNEIKAGIFSLFLLVPYYLIVYFYRSNIKKEINFTIEKFI